ncbi:MAG TPA: hypothetical protein VND65_18175 [Candidatus Binatia bacterium]|nr:hypothetical protein [Candidatus Binatia bacterium]
MPVQEDDSWLPAGVLEAVPQSPKPAFLFLDPEELTLPHVEEEGIFAFLIPIPAPRAIAVSIDTEDLPVVITDDDPAWSITAPPPIASITPQAFTDEAVTPAVAFEEDTWSTSACQPYQLSKIGIPVDEELASPVGVLDEDDISLSVRALPASVPQPAVFTEDAVSPAIIVEEEAWIIIARVPAASVSWLPLTDSDPDILNVRTTISAGASSGMETGAVATEPYVALAPLSTTPQIGQTGTELEASAAASNVEALAPSPAPPAGVTGVELEISAGGKASLHE